MINTINFIGKISLSTFQSLGKVILFSFMSFYWLFKKTFLFQTIFISNSRYCILFFASCWFNNFFSGMVLALQTFSGFDNFNDENTISKIVLTSILRELGPVLAGLMVCGRVGAKMAAEIATMRVSNQIDALETLSTRPMQYIISTRLLASIVAVHFWY